MATTENVHVHLSDRSYDIEIGSGNLGRLGDLLVYWGGFSHAVVFTDSNVDPLHAGPSVANLEAAGMRVSREVIAAGEASKSLETCCRLWQRMLDHGTDRKSAVVAVGGGVVGDLAGFMAATFARGVAFVQVPTTLLAQVDSSVGGKTGVNLPAAKNMVGSFWQPLGVLIDTGVLDTLPVREYRAGLAEVVKYGVIMDAEFFAYLEQHADDLNAREPAVLRQVIARCCRLKADVVQADEREITGLRAVLNYGHTFGHAVEAESGYGEVLHGEAVSMGMLAASRLAERLGRIGSDVTQRQDELLTRLGLPVQMPSELEPEVLLASMGRDKKVAHGQLRLVLPSRLGHVELVSDVPRQDVLAAMR